LGAVLGARLGILSMQGVPRLAFSAFTGTIATRVVIKSLRVYLSGWAHLSALGHRPL